MTREELDFIGSMNMHDEISNEAYKKIACHFEGQEPCDDAISRQAVINSSWELTYPDSTSERVVSVRDIEQLPSVKPQAPKTGHCKDCKWWKDSDGLYRRGSHAESKCPINRKEVLEGSGYCYMFGQKMESEVQE